MNVIKILWTGGWDSSFRIVSLSNKEVKIIPYYLMDDRDSERKELEAIELITKEINKRKTSKCVILPINILRVADVESDDVITSAYNELRGDMFMGSQYEWLSRFSKNHNGMELCIHKDDKAYEVIKKFGDIKRSEEGDLYTINQSQSSDNINKLFGVFNYPLLHMSKLDMKLKAEEMGLSDIMDMTWFCHTPIDDEPCGVCNPCIYTIEEGMSYRFSSEAIRRYKRRKIIKVARKISNRFNKIRETKKSHD